VFGEILVVGATLCWALGASLYKKGLLNVEPLIFNLLRSIPAAIYAFIMVYLLGKWEFLFELNLISIFYIGVSSIIVLALGDTLYFIGLRSIGVSKTVPIVYSYSIFVSLITTTFLGESLTNSILLGTIAILLGVWLATSQTEEEVSGKIRLKLGILAALCTSLCWACGFVLFKIILVNIDAFVLASVRMLVLIPILGLLSLFSLIQKNKNFKNNNFFHFSKLKKFNIFIIFLSGLISLGIGDTFLYLALENTKANIVAPISSTTPLVATLIAIFFFREKVSKRIIIGTVLVTAGVILLSIN
jgi:DME family drug/metabolite transporter